MRARRGRFGVGLDDLQKRDAIVASARRVFGQHGYLAATVEDILAEAKLARRTFYRYFTSKEDVLQAVLDELGERLRSIGESVRPHGVDPREFDELVAHGAKSVVAAVLEQRDILGILLEGLSVRDRTLYPATRALLARGQSILEDFLTAALEHGLIRRVNVRVVAELLMDINVGILRRFLDDGDERAVYRTLDTFLSMMRTGLLSERSE